jgi:hypothetical protein
MHRQKLPGSWEGTANYLEVAAFVAKDAPFCIDDFKPSESLRQSQALHASADRVIRGQGNGSGRGGWATTAPHARSVPRAA